MLADRVREFSDSTGTDAFALLGAPPGYRTFVAALGIGTSCWYCIQAIDSMGTPTGDWEVGQGIVQLGALVRNLILASSASGERVDFAVGLKDVYVDAPAALLRLILNPVGPEVPSGSINGSNRVFQLAHAPYPGSLLLTRNGLVQQGSGNDYQLAQDTITFAPDACPTSGDILLAFYALANA